MPTRIYAAGIVNVMGEVRPTSGRVVGIVGTFDVENYGDLLFPLIAEAELTTRLPGVTLRAYAPTAPAQPWPFVVIPAARLAHEASELCTMLIGGGQLVRFDPTYPVTLGEGVFAPDLYCLHPALAAEAASVPLVWNAIGAWAGSPRCSSREAIFGRLIAGSAMVGVRDEPTRAIFTRMASGTPIELVPDTAFGLSALWPRAGDSPEQLRWRAEQGLDGGYVVVQADRRIARHLDILAELQRRLGSRMVVLPVCRCHGDRAEGFPALDCDTDRVGGWPSPHRIREIIAGADLVVASSLHAAITAVSYGVRVARVTYPYERKFELLDGFAGVAKLDDTADFERLLARSNGIEPKLREHQTKLLAYWDRVAEIAKFAPNRARWSLTLPGLPPPLNRPPVVVQTRIAASTMMRRARHELRGLLRKARPARYRDCPILNLAAIRHARMESEPYCWGRQTGLFTPEDAARLAANYPTSKFWTIAGVEPGRHYHYTARSLIAMGSGRPHGAAGLSDAWLALALDLLSPEYRAAVSDAVGLDLTDAPMEANITQYGRGHSLSPHVDLKEKLVTQIFYFNDDWDAADGGCLEIMRASDESAGAALIPPLLGTSALLVRSHRSWHRVTPVRDGLDRQRRSLNVIFHLPGSKSTMWPQWPIAAQRTVRQLIGPIVGRGQQARPPAAR
ncbi:MAG TPA: polysaccharide pyruvyl transferase family protein [Novosphingobium sp.]|nr:polysaccharide pyruvyl transferase family protein [Novosphingobium sp.]